MQVAEQILRPYDLLKQVQSYSSPASVLESPVKH